MSQKSTVYFMGNLGADPECYESAKGLSIGKLNVACTQLVQLPDSDQCEKKTIWNRVIVFGKQADFICQHLKKGSRVGVVGHLKTRQYTNKEGDIRSITEVIAKDISFLDSDLSAPQKDTKHPSQ